MNRHVTREHEMIRQARIRQGLSQQQVATLISIQIRQYQRLEYGETDVQRLGIKKLCDGQVITLIEFFDTEEFRALEQEIQ